MGVKTSMQKTNRLLLKAAHQIHDQLMQQDHQPLLPTLPDRLWQRLVTTTHEVKLAYERQLHLAARAKWRELPYLLDELQQNVERWAAIVREQLPIPSIATPAEIFRDLSSLEQEFPALKVDIADHLISLTTEDVVLEELTLGPFEIQLDWQSLAAVHPYRSRGAGAQSGNGERQRHPSPRQRSDALRRRWPQGRGPCIGRRTAAGLFYHR